MLGFCVLKTRQLLIHGNGILPFRPPDRWNIYTLTGKAQPGLLVANIRYILGPMAVCRHESQRESHSQLHLPHVNLSIMLPREV